MAKCWINKQAIWSHCKENSLFCSFSFSLSNSKIISQVSLQCGTASTGLNRPRTASGGGWQFFYRHSFLLLYLFISETFFLVQRTLPVSGSFNVRLGQWLWLSWQSTCFRYQRSTVWIQSSGKFKTVNCWKDENKQKEVGNGPFF